MLTVPISPEDHSSSLLSTSRAWFWVRNYDFLGWTWLTGHHCPSQQKVDCEMFTKALWGRVQCLFLSWWKCGGIRVSGGQVPWQRERSRDTCCVLTMNASLGLFTNVIGTFWKIAWQWQSFWGDVMCYNLMGWVPRACVYQKASIGTLKMWAFHSF